MFSTAERISGARATFLADSLLAISFKDSPTARDQWMAVLSPVL